MSAHERLLSHPVPVDKTAALHIAGGNRTGREELLWAQREAFDRAMVEARIEAAQQTVEARQRLERARSTVGLLKASDHLTHLHADMSKRRPDLKPGWQTFHVKDYSKHVAKLKKKIRNPWADAKRFASQEREIARVAAKVGAS